jgi:hypothetical protein
MSWSDVRWYVQRNLGNARDLAALTDALEGLGVTWEHVDLVPFSDDVPDVSTEGRALFYGSTTLIKNVSRDGRWRPGVYFNEARFEFASLLAGYGDALLNGDSEVLTVGELVARDYADDALFFVRPAADLKEFTGEVMAFSDVRRWRDGLAGTTGPPPALPRVPPPRSEGRTVRGASAAVVPQGSAGCPCPARACLVASSALHPSVTIRRRGWDASVAALAAQGQPRASPTNTRAHSQHSPALAPRGRDARQRGWGPTAPPSRTRRYFGAPARRRRPAYTRNVTGPLPGASPSRSSHAVRSIISMVTSRTRAVTTPGTFAMVPS